LENAEHHQCSITKHHSDLCSMKMHVLPTICAIKLMTV